MKHLFAGALVAATLAAPVWADPITVETARGEVTLADSPDTVAVYDMAALDTLDALGVPVAGSINDIYLDDLKSYEGDLGTLFEPDFEALHALAPDVVIAGGRSAAQVDALNKIAPTLDMTIGADLVADMRKRIDTYGALFGKPEKAEELHAELDAEFAAAQSVVQDKGKALIILTNGPKIAAYGTGSRFGWIHDALGLPEAAEGLDVSNHGEAVSFEFIHDVNPDWLLVIDRVAAINAEGDSAQTTLDNALVHETTAWEKGHVVYLNAGEMYLSGGGVNSMRHTLDILTKAFGAAS
nr:siderophore ABC transporter substrate-binding protein [uncultured Celeribacter sp.]